MLAVCGQLGCSWRGQRALRTLAEETTPIGASRLSARSAASVSGLSLLRVDSVPLSLVPFFASPGPSCTMTENQHTVYGREHSAAHSVTM